MQCKTKTYINSKNMFSISFRILKITYKHLLKETQLATVCIQNHSYLFTKIHKNKKLHLF